jgi:alkylation response protein AidB-like acyl-CoA dehydrogenase
MTRPAGSLATSAMTTDTVPAACTPLDIARALAPRIRQRAAEIEAARQLPPDLVMEIANARLFKVALSEAEGGLGADIITTLRVIEEVARADGSTGWCLAMGINTFRQSAQFAPDVRQKLFHSDPVGISAGSANPRGRAVAVAGGYRVSGRWFFASGCMHSSLLHGACKVFDGDAPRRRPNGDQDIRIVYFCPKSLARIIDTWNVSGMRGTGSHDIEVDDVFVPDEHTFSALDRRARVTGPMNRMHGFDLAGCGFCSVGLGVARAAIDAFVELAQVKIPRSASELLRDRVMVQAHVGEAEALLRSGRALLFDAVEEMWQTVVAGESVTERQRSDLRLAMTHAAQTAARATHMVCAAAGTTSIFAESPLERYARDAEVVTRHNQLQFVNYEAVGRTVLGLESNSPLF